MVFWGAVGCGWCGSVVGRIAGVTAGPGRGRGVGRGRNGGGRDGVRNELSVDNKKGTDKQQ